MAEKLRWSFADGASAAVVWGRRRNMAALLTAAQVLWLPAAYASTVEWHPSVGLSALYDDNQRLSANPIEVYGRTVALGLMAGDLGEQVDWRARIDADTTRYSGEALPDDSTQSVLFGTERRGERSVFRGRVSYRRDTTTVSGTDPIGADLGDTDPGLVAERVRRQRLIASPSWRWQTSELSRVGAEYRGTLTDYRTDGVSGLEDYLQHSVRLNSDRQLNELNSLGAALGWSRYETQGSDRRFDNYGLELTWERTYAEHARFMIAAGVRNTEASSAGSDDKDTGLTMRATWIKQAAAYRLQALAERDVSPSGAGGLLETDQVYVDVRKNLSEAVVVSGRLRAFETRRVIDVIQDERRYMTVEPRIEYRGGMSWSLGLFYRYRAKERTNDGEGVIDGNAVFAEFRYRPQALEERATDSMTTIRWN